MAYIKLLLPVSGKEQIWDNTTHVDISAPDIKCTTLKYTTERMQLGTQL